MNKMYVRTSFTLLMVVALYVFAPVAHAETYEYDSVGRLTKVVYDDSTSITYVYDDNGNVLTRTAGVEPPPATTGCGARGDVIVGGFGSDGWMLVFVLASLVAAGSRRRGRSGGC